MDKDKIIITKSQLSLIDDLTTEQTGELFKAIKTLMEGGNPALDLPVKLALKALTTETSNSLCSSVPAVSTPDSVNDIFIFWRIKMHKNNAAKLTPKRKRLIEARLKQGYSIDDIKKAIIGCASSDYHMGSNESGKCYNCLSLICRDGEHIEQFMQYADAQTPAQQHQQQMHDIKTGAVDLNSDPFSHYSKDGITIEDADFERH